MKKFEFQEKGHKYFLDDKPLTGVTTVLNVIAKPALIQWAANMATDYISKEWKSNVSYSMDAIKIILDEARKAHCKKKEEAGQKGTDVHTLIETYIKLMISDQGGVAMEINGYDNEQVKHFVEWAVKNKIKFLESEKKMYSEKHWIAGTCDFTCEIKSKKYVGDIKTSSGIYDRTPFFQTAGYRLMLEEMGEKDYAGSVIINIKKDGKFDEKKDVYYSFDYQSDLDGFLAALKLYRTLKNY